MLHEYNDIMLVIETLDTTPSAAVLSIGAVKFNSDGLGEAFYARLDSSSQLPLGRTQSEATGNWWAEQSDAARAEVFVMPEWTNPMTLLKFSQFFDHDDYNVWGNGSAFDNVIVKSLFCTYGFTLPWKYNKNRCLRTIRETVYGNFPFLKDDQIKPELAHHALSDAKAQALDLLRIEARTQIILMVDMADTAQVEQFKNQGSL